MKIMSNNVPNTAQLEEKFTAVIAETNKIVEGIEVVITKVDKSINKIDSSISNIIAVGEANKKSNMINLIFNVILYIVELAQSSCLH